MELREFLTALQGETLAWLEAQMTGSREEHRTGSCVGDCVG